MKKNVLALSLALCLPFTASFAQEQPMFEVVDATAIDAAAGTEHAGISHESVDEDDQTESTQQETTEQYIARMRPEIMRLYPDYVTDDPENKMLYQYLEYNQRRQQEVPFFDQAQQSMQHYLTHQQAPKLSALNPDKSKLDALLYDDLSTIYTDVEQIQNTVAPYLKFNQTIFEQVDMNAPFPAFTEQDDRRYDSAMDSMHETYKKQADALARLVNKIDDYRQKVEQFQNIDSKRVYKAHLENIDQLNIFVLVLGRFLNAQVKAEDAFSMASRGYNKYQAEDHPAWGKKFIQYINSEQNQKRIQPLLANLPDRKSVYGTDALTAQIKELSDFQKRCESKWFDENDEQFMVNGKLDQAKIAKDCQKNQQTLQQLLVDQVQVKALAYESAKVPNLNFLGDFRVYGDELYYTDTEKNAVYRFDTKSLQEQLIYQHPLKIEQDGCDHNMCRGVGATDVVLSKDGKIAYVASLDYNQVFAIDLARKQVIEKYDVERYPRKLLLDEKGENLFVYNGVANSISKIQLASGKIQTQALPESHQGHFCREIDLSFSPISGDIKILGDWPTDPYIYMNSQDMSFYQSDIEVPYEDVYLYDDYQYVVKITERDAEAFAVYDLRLNRLTKQFNLRADDEEDDRYYSAWERPDYLHSVGELAGIGQYFVEQVVEKVPNPNNEERDTTQYQYVFHLQQDKGASSSEKTVFKLAFQPYKIVALNKHRIMVFGAEDGYSRTIPTENMAIYDLDSAQNKAILASNRQKLQAKTTLNVENLIEDERD